MNPTTQKIKSSGSLLDSCRDPRHHAHVELMPGFKEEAILLVIMFDSLACMIQRMLRESPKH